MNKLTISQINCCQGVLRREFKIQGENAMSANLNLNDTNRQVVACYDENTVYCDWFAWL